MRGDLITLQDITEHWHGNKIEFILENRLDNIFRNYCKVVKSPELLFEREKKFKENFRKLYYRLTATYNEHLDSLFKSNEKERELYNNSSDLISVGYQSIMEDLLSLPELFIEVITLNDQKWKKKVDKFKGGHIVPEKQRIYAKVFEVYDKDKLEEKKPNWSRTFDIVSESKNSNGDFLISDEKDRKTIKKSFCNFRSRNKLFSLNDFKKYLKKHDYPI
jgi:hypothetical protein